MKRMLLMFSILLMLSFASVTSAKNLPYKNLLEAAKWSTIAKAATTSVSLDKLPYKNLTEVARWSRMINGRMLSASLRKKAAHASPVQDFTDDELFAIGDAERGGPCNWACCMRYCLQDLPESFCGTNCLVCALTGAPWSCAVCASCGAVGIAALELCSIHCCIAAGGC